MLVFKRMPEPAVLDPPPEEIQTAAGGVKIGNESHKLALKLYDNQSDVNLSVRQYTQLVSQDKVDFLLGPFASNFALADSAVSEKYKIPMVQGGGASDQIFSRHFKYIFGTLAPASNYFGSTVEMLKGLDPAPKSVALLYADDAFDVSVAEGTRPKLKQAGLALAMDERYSTNATDFNSLLDVLLGGVKLRTLDIRRAQKQAKALEAVLENAEWLTAEEIGERHRFLSEQRADLDKAIADLRSLADDLASTIAEQFSATFQAVDREFGVFFQRLFNGGQASLRTSEDPDEPGIDIYARPPGKRIGSLQQLSGGERALTATALLLAILRVRPAPFCVLDEVDAALDERNVGRFTQALRELTDRTQFVVITHNRGTIEAADMLYGVSMDDGGVSKVISLRLSELDAERAG